MFPITVTVVKYLDLFLLALFMGYGYYMYLRKPRSEVCRRLFSRQAVILIVFNLASFVLILLHERQTAEILEEVAESGVASVETPETLGEGIKYLMSRLNEWAKAFMPSWLKLSVVYTILIYAASMVFMYLLLLSLYKNTNRLLWNAVFMLISVGFIVLWRLDQDAARYQVYWILIGFAAVNVVMLIFRGRWLWRIPAWVYLVLCVGLILLPFAFPQEAGGSLNWASIGGHSFQPSEFVKVIFAFFLAVLYTRYKKRYACLIALALSGFMFVVLLVQRDLGALLIFGILTWLMTYDYIGQEWVLFAGAALAALGSVVAYKLFSHVQVRVNVWLDPWADITDQGYQIAQSLFAIADGGFLGTGLFLGSPGYIPARTTDMIFAVIVEEMGGCFAIGLVLLYLLIFLFVMETGTRERNRVRRNLLVAFGILFMTQSFIIIGGVIKLIPLTGVTLPFISYGGSSLISNFVTIGIIEAVIRLYRIDREEARQRAREEQFYEEELVKQELIDRFQSEQKLSQNKLGEGKNGGKQQVSKPNSSQNRSQSANRKQQTGAKYGTKKQGSRRKQESLQPFNFDDPF